ncbi:MAG: polysaccharide deacetylase family protein [Candidatus Dormibacteraeota bacterium]|nr:polysaccharide deacetylase family protein [Candidatus Dormibacteraeota bacterium]
MYLQGRQVLPARPLILTFDDGYRDFHTTALPILRRHRFTAVAYVVPGFVGRQRYLSSEQMREIDAAGIEIGSHTVNHPDLTALPAPLLEFQLRASKSYLENLLGHPVLDFCYPSGRYNAGVAAAVQAAGYESATTVEQGSAHAWPDRYSWTRIRVVGGESLETFVTNLGPIEPVEIPTPTPPPPPRVGPPAGGGPQP